MAAAVSSAKAAPWPASVVGTWDAWGNTSHFTLNITSQTSTVGLECQTIVGALSDLTHPGLSGVVKGFYCPDTGRISFLRSYNATPEDYFQTWTGNLSNNGKPLRMGGTLTDYTGATTSQGEFNFNATKPTVN
jgi:hypothetical protein